MNRDSNANRNNISVGIIVKVILPLKYGANASVSHSAGKVINKNNNNHNIITNSKNNNFQYQ